MHLRNKYDIKVRNYKESMEAYNHHPHHQHHHHSLDVDVSRMFDQYLYKVSEISLLHTW